jgi:two-component system LytT family sensor kinase
MTLQHRPFVRGIIHLGFWVFVFFLYTLFFAQTGRHFTHIFLFVGMLLPITMVATYFTNYYLVPVYLLSDRHLLFLLYFSYTLIGALFLETVITMVIYFLVAELDIHEISPAAIDIRYTLAAFLMIIFLGVVIKLLSYWRESRHQYNQLLKDKMEAELRFLRSQLNPHFLFNTLNNLYCLAIEKSDLAPKAIMALSELLHYILDETRGLFVPLAREIELVRNFIELEQLRFGDRNSICLETTEQPETQTLIAPMLLLTLVENAFKHGVGRSYGQHFIHISVKSEDEWLVIRVENSIQKGEISEKEGIGLSNLRSQLDLLYSDRHQFSTQAINDRFVAILRLSP